MARKSTLPKNIDTPLMPENPSLEGVEPHPSNGSGKPSGDVHSQLGDPHLKVSPWKHPNSSLDGVFMHHERSPAQQQASQEYELQKKSRALKKRKPKYYGSSVRRSERIKSAAVLPSNSNLGIEYIEPLTVSESEKDEPDTQLEQVLPELEPEPEPAVNSSEKSLEEKVDYALQRIEALDKIIELLKSKVDEVVGSCEAPSMASISYRSMYIDLKKEVEALTDENRRLSGRLENALGKIEVYEKENHVLIEVLDKMKDAVNAVVVSNLAKTTEAAVNASAQAIRNVASAAKRKRNAQQS